MPKGIRKIELGEDQIQRLFLDLAKLEPPKKPTMKEVLETHKGNIETALKRGNSLRDVAKFLTDGGLKVSHETLRKLAEEWGFTTSKQKSVQKKPEQASVKNNTGNKTSQPLDSARKTTEKASGEDAQNGQEPASIGRFKPRKDLENL